jgi:hypothetical protein
LLHFSEQGGQVKDFFNRNKTPINNLIRISGGSSKPDNNPFL